MKFPKLAVFPLPGRVVVADLLVVPGFFAQEEKKEKDREKGPGPDRRDRR